MKKTKKIIIISLIIFFLSMPLVFAKTPDAFPRLTYIIGTHEFTPYGEMTTQKIMLAAQTIPDGELDDMIIYYKNSRGQWVNAALPNRPPVTLPEYFIIHFVDLVGMEVKPATITTNPDDVSALGPEEILKFTLATETVGAELYYTTNGQSPIEHGKEYTNQVTHWLGENNYLGKTLTIQAVAKKDGYYSEITTKDVTFEGLYDFELGKIIKYKGTAANVVIPSAIGGVTVDTIGEEAFDQNTTLKNVTIPSSVEVIEDKAFYVNTNLETLTFGVGSNLTTIGKWAFEQAEKLTALTIPESVTKIDEGAFAGATVLKSVRLPAGLTEVGERVFFDSGLEEVFIPSNTVIGNYMFAECANLTTVTIGADVVFGDIPFTLDFVNDTLKEAYKTHLTGGTGVYKLIEGVWTNTTKLDLDNAIFTFEHKLDDDIWDADLKVELEEKIRDGKIVLADAEATLGEIEGALEDLFIKAFRASHEKKGKKFLVPLFDGAYGIASYADLEDHSKQWAYAGEAPGFVNMEQLLLTTFAGEGAERKITEIRDLDSLDDIIGIIDRGIEFYLNLLDSANYAENVEDVKDAFEEFIQHTIEVYGDWEGAKIGVNELPYLVIDHGDHYEIIDEVVEVIFENRPYTQILEMYEAVIDATTERYGVLNATVHTIEGYLGTDRFPKPGELYADELDNALDEVRLVLANPTLKGIEESMENLFVVGFQAAQHKKGLQVMVPLFITAYGNANFEVLTSDQQGRDEALGFINMEKVKRSDFDNDGKLTAVNLGSVMSITAMIDDAVSEYWGVLNGINYSELEYIGDVLSNFVQYTVEVYDDWTGAYKNVTELAHIAEDNPLYPDDDPGEFRIIDGVPERIYAARQLIGLFDTLTEVVTAAATP